MPITNEVQRRAEVFPAQQLTGALEFFLIKTPDASLVIDADEETETKDFLEQNETHRKILNIVRLRANVVIIGSINDEDISVAVEFESAADPQEMQDLIQELGSSVPFGNRTVDLSTVVVQKEDLRLFDSSRTYTP